MRILQYHTDDTTAQQAEVLHELHERHYDLLHIHGCWQQQAWQAARVALKRGTRLVFSPNGQLEPWVMHDGYWKEKLPKRLLYQRWIASKAYAVIVQGKMEEECLRRLGWNPRLVIIRNPRITSTITQQEADRQLNAIYRKVMDTNTLELMNDATRCTLNILIKAGITGDVRWIADDPLTLDNDQWRQVLCYAHQEQITDVLTRGINLFRLEAPDIDVSNTDCFLPEGFEPVRSIESVTGSSFVSENDRLVATFRLVKKLVSHRRLAIAHLVELDKELRNHYIEEERLCEELDERHLLNTTARVMQLMHDLTGLTEGFMPVPPLNDRTTRQMRRQVDNHLKVV